MLLQIFTAQQIVLRFMCDYPHIILPDANEMLEALGRRLGAPTKEQLAIAATIDDMTAEWEDLELYLADITQQQAIDHVPLATRRVVKKPTLPSALPAWFAAVETSL